MAKKNDITSTEKLLELIRSKEDEPNAKDGGRAVKKKRPRLKGKPAVRRRSKKDIRVGIDINQSDITLAVVEHVSEKRQKLLEIRRVALAPDTQKGSNEFIKLLKNSLKEVAGKYKAPALWATISSADVETRFLQIPKVPARQVPNAVRFAYRKEAAIDESHIFDFNVIDTAYADGEQKKKVVAYTAPKNEINATRELFNKAGWPLKGISIVPFGIQNLLKAGWIESAGKNVCTLFIGRDWSRIAIFSKNVLILSRDIKAGARSMVQAILETLDKKNEQNDDTLTVAMPEEEIAIEPARVSPNLQKAENLFAEFIAVTPIGESAVNKLKREKLIFEMVKPALDRVIRQVEMTLEHFGLNFDSNPIDNVYISGELSAKKSIAAYIGKQLGLPVAPMNPFANAPESITANVPGTGDRFVPAAGMALSQSETTPNFIFTYEHKRKKAFAKKFNLVANIVFIGMIGVAMAVFYFQTQKVNAIKAEITPLQMELEAYSPRLDRNLMASVTGQTVKRMKDYAAVAGYYLPVSVLSELTDITPDTVELVHIQVTMGAVAAQKVERTGKILNIEGLIPGNSRDFERRLTEYLVRLKNSPFFKQPKVKEKLVVESEAGQALRFVVSMAII